MNAPDGIHIEVAKHDLALAHSQDRTALLPVDVVAARFDRNIYPIPAGLDLKYGTVELNLA